MRSACGITDNFPVHFDLVTGFRDIERSEIPDVPTDDGVERECLIDTVRKLSRQRPPDAFLRIHVPERFVRAVYPEPSVPDGKRVARQSDTPFDVVFQDMHLDLVPAVGMREVEDQHVAPLCFPKSRCAVYLGLFQPQRRVESNSRAPSVGFQTATKSPSTSSRLHRVAGDAEGGEEEDLREEPKGDQNHQSEK